LEKDIYNDYSELGMLWLDKNWVKFN
jgi:hypothetical protein